MMLKVYSGSFLKVMFRAIVLSSLSIFICVTVAVSAEDHPEILVIGTAAISKGNVAEARKRAISEAMIRGVEEYLSYDLGRQGMVNNFPRLVQEVLPGSKEVIENFHILAEDQANEVYKILVRVKVNQQIIEEKLKAVGLVRIEGPPVKILFIVSQRSLENGDTVYWWGDPGNGSGLTSVELSFYRIFQDYGFEPVNRISNMPEEDYTSEMTELHLSDEAVLGWGKIISSDAVIHGMCEIAEDKTVSVSLKVIGVESGDVLYQDYQIEYPESSGESTGQKLEPMERAITAISMRLGPEIINALDKDISDVEQFEVQLNGLKSFAQFMTFRDFLKNDISGVQAVRQTRIKGNAMAIQVEFKGEKSHFFDNISGNDSFPFSAVVRKSEDGEISVDID